MSFLWSRLWALKQTLRGLWLARGQFVLALVLASLALTIPVFLGSLFWSFSQPVINVPLQTEITVFTKNSLQLAQVQKLAEGVSSDPLVAQIRIIDRAQALELVNRNLGIRTKRTSNPLPHILVITVGKNVSGEETTELASRLEKLPGVDSIAYDDKWAHHLSALMSAGSLILFIMGSIILTLVMLVVATSVRMMTNTQREEIRALYIFGASKSFICRPYAWRGALTMAMAMAIALGASGLGLGLISEPVADLATLYDVKIRISLPSTDWCVLFVLLSALFGLISGNLAALETLSKERRRAH